MSKYLRNRETGVIHRIADDGASHEEDNLDEAREAGNLDEMSEEAALMALSYKPDDGCAHCFKEQADDDAEDSD